MTTILNDLNRIFLGGPNPRGEISEETTGREVKDALIRKVALCALAAFVVFFVLPSLLPVALCLGAIYVIAHVPTSDPKYPRYIDYFLKWNPSSERGIHHRHDHVGHNGHRVDGDCCSQDPQHIHARGGGARESYLRADNVGSRGTGNAQPLNSSASPSQVSSGSGLQQRTDNVGSRGTGNPQPLNSSASPSQVSSGGGLQQRTDNVGNRGTGNAQLLNSSASPSQVSSGSGLQQRTDNVGSRSTLRNFVYKATGK